MNKTDFTENSLTLFRYIAAIQVMFGHFELLEVTFPVVLTFPFDLFQGVPVFFGISGFLIWKSLARTPDFRTYAVNRFLRIYPELWIGVALSVTTVIIFYKEKIQWFMLGIFIVTQATFLQFWTPDFLRQYGTGTPNGSLWTICTFFQFYIVAYFAYEVLKDRGLWTWVVALTVSVTLDITYPLLGGVLPSEMLHKLYGQTILPYMYLFLTGMFVSRYFETIMPVLKKTWWLFLAMEALMMTAGFNVMGAFDPLRTICAVLAALGLAYAIPANIQMDITYEMYIFHGVFLNLFIELGLVGGMKYAAAALALSVAASLLARWLNGKIVVKVMRVRKD